MPAERGLGLDEEVSAASARKQPAQPGEHSPISRPQSRTFHLPAQEGNLVAKHDDFDGQLLLAAPREPDLLKQTDEG